MTQNYKLEEGGAVVCPILFIFLFSSKWKFVFKITVVFLKKMLIAENGPELNWPTHSIELNKSIKPKLSGPAH